MLKKIIGTLLILIISSPLLMHLFWVATPEKQLNILILDKTVLDKNTQEHRSFYWILNNEKFIHSKSGFYNNEKDYYGLFPNDSGSFKIYDFNKQSIKSLDSISSNYDMTYYTDLYGVYEGEWYQKYPNEKSNKVKTIDNSMEHTRKLYGGMTTNELSLLKKMKFQHKLVITEFNVISSPTATEIRKGFEKTFEVRWTGWVGRYYETLDTLINKELPRWMKMNYLTQHDNKWPFQKSGIVFVREDDRIEILENNIHLDIELPIIHTSEFYMKKYGLPAEIKYSFWFDIMNTDSKNKVVSTYKICTNRIGKALLKEYGIPEVFPAVIEHDSTDYKFYYFAGDFCDNPIGINTAKFKWISYFNAFSYKKSTQERVSFFWNFYRPMVKEILSNYYENKQ